MRIGRAIVTLTGPRVAEFASDCAWLAGLIGPQLAASAVDCAVLPAGVAAESELECEWPAPLVWSRLVADGKFANFCSDLRGVRGTGMAAVGRVCGGSRIVRGIGD